MLVSTTSIKAYGNLLVIIVSRKRGNVETHGILFEILQEMSRCLGVLVVTSMISYLCMKSMEGMEQEG